MQHDWKSRAVIAGSVAVLAGASLAVSSGAQKTPAQPAAAAAAAELEHAMDLASRGHCVQALPTLKRDLPHITAPKFRYAVAMLSAQCGMSTDDEATVIESLLVLNREHPKDPEVLFITTRYLSELANRTAQRLLKTAPDSPQAEQMLADAYEERGQYADATAKYRQILKQFPNQPGIHYQLGRILLAKPLTPASAAAARKEFEAELKVNPDSPAAEFMLGDLAMRTQNDAEAIEHFTRAIQMDVELPQPYLGLGMALNAAGKYAEAIQTLKKFVQLQPEDPAGYYQLSIAYSRTGNKQEAERQLSLQREALKHWTNRPSSPDDMLQPH